LNLNSLQYKIPQNVGIEDRIVGPLTLRQLIILAAGFGISYVLFAALSKLYEMNVLEYIIILFPALIATAFALIKINDIRLPKFILLFLEFAIKPKRRLWDHRGIAAIVAPDLSEIKKEAPAQTGMDEKTKKATNLRDLAHMLDSENFEHVRPTEYKKIDEAEDDDLISEAYFGHKDSSTENMYWRTKKSHIKMLDIFAKLPITKVKQGSKEAEIMKQEIAGAKAEAEAVNKKSSPQATSAPAQTSQATSAESRPKKKSRKRKRRTPQPIRTGNHVNNTQKNQPAEYLPKKSPIIAKRDPASEESQPQKKEFPKKDGEFKFEELKKGEIEINLD